MLLAPNTLLQKRYLIVGLIGQGGMHHTALATRKRITHLLTPDLIITTRFIGMIATHTEKVAHHRPV